MGILSKKRPTISDILGGGVVETATPEPSKPLVAPAPAAKPEPLRRSVREISDDDRIDELCNRGWLVLLPEWSPCEHHGHGLWWEDKSGALHCVKCWPQPPLRSMVRFVWEGGDAGNIFPNNAGETLLLCRPGECSWPWPEEGEPQEAF